MQEELVSGVLLCLFNSNGSDLSQLQSYHFGNELRNADLACVVTRDVRGLGCADGVIGVVSAKIVSSFGNGCGEYLQSLVINEYARGSLGDLYANLACLILINVNVLLGLAVHEVDSVAAFNSLKLYVNSLVSLIGGCKVVFVHVAGKVEVLTQICLVKSKLVSSFYICLLYLLGNVGCGNKSCKVCGELGNANLTCVVTRDVRGLGCADGVVSAVSTKIVSSLGNGCGEYLQGLIVNEYARGSLGDLYANLACLILINVNVLLGLAVHKVHSEAAFNSLKLYVNSLVSLLGGCKVVFVHITGKVEVLAQVCLVKSKLVRGISLCVRNELGQIQVGGSSLNDYLVGHSLGLSATGNGESDGNGSVSLGKGYGDLTGSGIHYCAIIIGGPGEGYLGISNALYGNGDSHIAGYAIGNLHSTHLGLDLFSIGTSGKEEVVKCLIANRVEVDSAAVKNNDTGYVSIVTQLFGVVLNDCSLHIIGNRCGKVGIIKSDVGLVIAQLELVVLGGLGGEILRGNLSALDGNQHTQLVYQILSLHISCVLKGLGNIKRSNFLYGRIQNGYSCVLNLVGAAVNVLGTCNGYGHTCLDSQILCGILIHGINVIATLILGIHYVELVVLVALFLGVNGNYDTLNYNGSTCLCCIVVSIGKNCVCGNNTLKGLGGGIAFCILNGCGQHVLDLSGGLFGNVNKNEAVLFSSLQGDVGNVNLPLNVKGNACYQYLANDLIVSGSVGGLGCAFVLVQVEQISCGVINRSRGGRGYGLGGCRLGRTGGVLAILGTRCERGQAESKQQQNGN